MRTIVHLSDLHFGQVDTRMLPPLLAAVTAARPNLVVVSGDFTQRARVQEFKDAARFVAALPGLRLLVPGNHDAPLYDLMRRWLMPFGDTNAISPRTWRPSMPTRRSRCWGSTPRAR